MSVGDLPIELSAYSPSPLERVPAAVIAAVIQRDHGTCRYCGICCNKYQTVVVDGDNWRDIGKIFTSCIFCQQCFYLDLAKEQRSGVLIWMPEFNQAELNRICQDIYVARISRESRAEVARNVLDKLVSRRNQARTEFGTDDPCELAAELRRGTDEKRGKFVQVLNGLRLLPLDRRIMVAADIEFNQFPQILAYWRSRSGPYSKYRKSEDSTPWLSQGEKRLLNH